MDIKNQILISKKSELWKSHISFIFLVLVAQSCPTLHNPWTVARQAPVSMEFPRQEYWSGLPFPSPEDLPHPGIKPSSPALQADSDICFLGLVWTSQKNLRFATSVEEKQSLRYCVCVCLYVFVCGGVELSSIFNFLNPSHHRFNGYEFEQTLGDRKKPRVLQSMWLQRVRHDLASEQQQNPSPPHFLCSSQTNDDTESNPSLSPKNRSKNGLETSVNLQLDWIVVFKF